MRFASKLVQYVVRLRPGKVALWCYLGWYLVTVALYFEPRPSIWLNAAGISAVVGTALLLSVNGPPFADRWQVFRLFMMPFGVSSFSALIKNKGFWLVFAPTSTHLLFQLGACVAVLAVVYGVKALGGGLPPAAPNGAA